jgi:hypothetical protein
MNITPHQVGAMPDLTPESHMLLDQVALAYAVDPSRFGQLLMGLATAREDRDELIENPGVDRPIDVIDSAEMDLKDSRGVLVKALVKAQCAEPVTFRLAETDCRRYAAQLTAAANQSATARAAAHTARLYPFPSQPDWRHAA